MSGTARATGLELRLLGPLEVRRQGEAIRIGGGRARALLADLILHLGDVVSIDRLVDDVWGERPPAKATHAVEVYASQLRKALDPEKAGLLVGRGRGYALEVEPECVDAYRFERLLRDGLAQLDAGEPARAAALLRDALTLWRGPALADLTYEPFTQGEIARLEELRTNALEARVAADLAQGQAAELIGELEALVAEQPFRERPRGQLMLALYRSGRQADALAAYRAARQVLVDELGIEPGPDLRELEAAIIRQDEALLVAAPTARIRETIEHRKVVTILFADVADWTSLAESTDAETLRRAIQRYFVFASAAIDEHGGTVEKFAGDAVMAVFGIPVAHEDDALRAARAALQLRHGLGELNDGIERDLGLALEIRVGLATGEVVAGDGAANELFATGDAVNLAARLQQAAASGEIVVDATTRRLIAHTAELQPLGELSLRGKRQREQAFKLLGVAAPAPAVSRRLDGQLVGRESELKALGELFEQAVRERTLRAALVLGPAGIGKSRLASELAAVVEDRATVLGGRCASYGEGITYLPLRAVVRDAAGGESRAEIVAALEGAADADSIADRLASAFGAGSPPPADEVGWAFRTFCISLARRRPVVLVLDDLHWAEPAFLELVDDLAARSRDAPILLLALARDELREEQPGFLRPADLVVLDELGPEDVEDLVHELGGATGLADETRRRIVEAAEGNPLFLEQLVALAVEDGLESDRPLPTTIQALLLARLDRLGPGERAVLEHAAVVGREFWRGAVNDLLEPAAAATSRRHLEALVRRGFVRPVVSAAAFEDAYRFRHVLIQAAAYGATPKADRARLHERHASLLEQAGDDDALIGYHLEQAYRYRAELGPLDRHARGLAADAGARLGSAGIRAWKTGDARATTNLLGRATTDLLPEDDARRRELLCELGVALRTAGQGDRADEVLRGAVRASQAVGDHRIELRARIELAYVGLLSRAQERGDELLDLAVEAIPLFDTVADERSLGRAWLLSGFVHGGIRCRHAQWLEHSERALAHYRASGWPTGTCLGQIAAALYHGPTPVAMAIERCEQLLHDGAAERGAEANVRVYVGGLEALRGRFTEARALVGAARTIFEDLGQFAMTVTHCGMVTSDIEMLAADPGAAERSLREVCEFLEQAGDYSNLATRAADLAEVLYAQARYDEAERWTGRSETVAAPDDLTAQPAWRSVRAKLLARRGDREQALALAQEAVRLAEGGDALNQQAKYLLGLAEMLRLAERLDEAADCFAEALRLYELKGNTVARDRIRSASVTPALV